MSYLYNIPGILFNNILLLGILWMVYQVFEKGVNLSSKKRFLIASSIQIIGTLLFVFDLFIPKTNFLFYIPYQNLRPILWTPDNPVILLLGAAYFLGLVLYIIRFAIQISKVQKIKAEIDYRTQQDWLQLLKTSAIAIPNHVKIGLSDKVKSPVVIGFLEPIILLPISICNQLSTEAIKLILIHELAHILRNDYMVNLCLSFSKIILWFNPFSYLWIHKINTLREMACDEFVMEHINSPIAYSKALYQLANQEHQNSPVFALGAINNNEHELLNRIKNINKITIHNKSGIQNQFSTLFILILALVGTLLFMGPTLTKINTQKSISTSPMAVLVKQNNSNALNSKYQKLNLNTPTLRKKKAVDAKQNTQIMALNINEQRNNTTKSNFELLLNETKQWIKQHENPIQLVNYSNEIDSIDNLLAERLLMTSIIKSYQLKRTIIAQQLAQAQDKNEAYDYLINSKEWADIVEYEKWAEEYLGRHQQSIGLSPARAKQQIQY